MIGEKSVWIVDSGPIEDKMRLELEQKIPGVAVTAFKSVCDAVDALRSGQKPQVILGNDRSWELMLELLYQPSKYHGIIPAYVSEQDLSQLAATHHTWYVKIGKEGSFDGLAEFVQKWAQ